MPETPEGKVIVAIVYNIVRKEEDLGAAIWSPERQGLSIFWGAHSKSFLTVECMQPIFEVIHANETIAYTNPSEKQPFLTPASIRLDLHGVLDILPIDVHLVKDRSMHKIACISFVGRNTRNEAIRDIRERIATGQIDYGVLVFKRGRGKDKFIYVEEGSKAWVNHYIPCEAHCIFVDDSTDHLRSTQLLNPHITCKLFNTGIPKQLLSILSEFEKEHS